MHRKISRSISIAAIALIVMVAARAHADTWNIDPVHSNVEFSVRHMMISNVKGQFEKVAGTIIANGKEPSSVQINATIDTSSLNTRNEKRDAHVKSPAFLDVEQYPAITFKSTRIEPAGEGKWNVTGDLTLHGVTKPVVLAVEGPTPPINDPFGNTRAGASATTKINRKDFGIVWNQPLETGGVLVVDEVAISIEVEAIKQ
jgi:polyisoprenoid-binding protein YceI